MRRFVLAYFQVYTLFNSSPRVSMQQYNVIVISRTVIWNKIHIYFPNR